VPGVVISPRRCARRPVGPDRAALDRLG